VVGVVGVVNVSDLKAGFEDGGFDGHVYVVSRGVALV
jgi:hypothetical protein